MLLSTMKCVRTLFWHRASLIFYLDFNTTSGIFLVSFCPASMCVVKGSKSKMNLEDYHKGRYSFGGQESEFGNQLQRQPYQGSATTTTDLSFPFFAHNLRNLTGFSCE